MKPIPKIFGRSAETVEDGKPDLAVMLAGCPTAPTLADEFESLSLEEKANAAHWLITAQRPDTEGAAISEAQLVRQWHGAIGFARANSKMEGKR